MRVPRALCVSWVMQHHHVPAGSVGPNSLNVKAVNPQDSANKCCSQRTAVACGDRSVCVHLTGLIRAQVG